MPYQYLDDVATADAAFEASGSSLEEMFVCASQAVMNVMVDDLAAIEVRERRDLQLEDDNLEMLLFEFLQEFIYYKDAHDLLLCAEEIKITNKNNRFYLQAVLDGEKIDSSRHALRVDIKAITLHRFQVVQLDGMWKAVVVVDI